MRGIAFPNGAFWEATELRRSLRASHRAWCGSQDYADKKALIELGVDAEVGIILRPA